MFVSNNLLSITIFADGKTLVDKTLAIRTFTGQMQPLEHNSSTMSLLDIAKALDLAKK